MLKTKLFYIYKSDNPINIEMKFFMWKDLDERTKSLFFDAQDDIEAAGFDMYVLEEDEDYSERLNEFLEHMDGREDHDEALAEIGMDELKFEFILSGETIVGYFIPDTQDPDISYVASFLPIPELADILVGIPMKQITDLPLLRNRRKGGAN